MLLLHDSLGYSSAAHFQGAGYTIIAGASPLFGQLHERPSATSIAQLSFQTPTVGAGSNATCVAGVMAWIVPLVFETVSFLEIGSSAGTQIRATMQKAYGGWKLFFYRGTSSDLLLETPFFEHSSWVFLEVKAVLSTTVGSIVVRLDGTEVARVEGVNTREQTGTLWDRLRLFAHTSLTVGFADLYLCDGRLDHGARFASFLGKVSHAKLPLGEPSTVDWSPIPVLPGKARLTILAGQSNMTGRIASTSSANWTNPNTRVRIWNRFASAFQSLSATVNSACAYQPANVPVAGPEMRFAERLSAHYAASGDGTTPNHYIVKGVQDGSWVFPVTPDYSWNSGVVGGLLSRLQTDIANAVTSLGGWSQIGAVDIFWLQGESDSIATASAITYQANVRQLLSDLIADIAANGPSVATHIVRIHRSLYRGTAPDSIGFYYTDQIRLIQEELPSLLAADLAPIGWDLKFGFIDLDTCQISPDLTHLTEPGYDRLGDLMFDSWVSTQSFEGLVDDYDTLPDIDSLWVGASDTGKSLLFRPSGAADSTNSPVLSVAAHMHNSAAAPGLIWATRAAGRVLGYNMHTGVAAPWFLSWTTHPFVVLPETLSSDVGVTT